MAHSLADVPAHTLGCLLLLFGAVFAVTWYLDHQTHERIWKKEITDGELRTHRMILMASYGLMGSLALMRWFPWEVLPIFVGAWITRFVHEFIDEIHWHLPRCTERETLIHLIMWISVHSGTALCFMWGFFRGFDGIESLPLYLLAPLGLVFLSFMVIGHRELFHYKSRHD